MSCEFKLASLLLAIMVLATTVLANEMATSEDPFCDYRDCIDNCSNQLNCTTFYSCVQNCTSILNWTDVEPRDAKLKNSEIRNKEGQIVDTEIRYGSCVWNGISYLPEECVCAGGKLYKCMGDAWGPSLDAANKQKNCWRIQPPL